MKFQNAYKAEYCPITTHITHITHIMSTYAIHDINTGLPDPSSLIIVKKKSIYEIRTTDDKELWLKVNQCSLKYGYAEDKFKADKAGNVMLADMNNLTDSVDAIDQFVIDKMTTQYQGRILNNIMITKDTVKKMFRASMYNGTLRVSVDPAKCPLFDNKGVSIESNDLTILKKGLGVQVFIQPSFAWLFNGKIGIKWHARQIKLGGPTTDQPEPDSDEDEPAAETPRTATQNLALFDDADDEE